MNPITAAQVFTENFIASLTVAIPLGLSFGAGMVAAVNPCGFVLLPAYLALYLRSNEQHAGGALVARALVVALVMTLGFVVLFGAAGLLIALGLRFVMQVVPWVALALGAGLAALGAAMLLGKKPYSSLGARLASRVGGTQRQGPVAFFLFGITYGIASLSCTLPIFLLVVVTPLVSNGVLNGAANFVNYGLGMGLVVTLVTLGVALLKGTAVWSVRRAMPVVERVSAVLILVAGAYIVYYWLTIGGLGAILRQALA